MKKCQWKSAKEKHREKKRVLKNQQKRLFKNMGQLQRCTTPSGTKKKKEKKEDKYLRQ